MKTFSHITLCGALLFVISCAEKKENNISTNKINSTKSTIKKEETKPTQKATIVNISDSLTVKFNVLCIKDSANNIEGLEKKFVFLFSKKIMETIKFNKLKVIGNQMAWFSKNQQPYFFEIGIPVDKAPANMGKGMYMKNVGIDSCYIAHFWGPQNLKIQGYTALNERIADANKTTTLAPFEIYKFNFDSTYFAKDAYKLETSIIVPFKSTMPKKAK